METLFTADPASCRLARTRSDEPARAPQTPPLRLRLPDERIIPLDDVVRLGADTACDVVLDDPFVSGRHCTIRREGGRTLLRDSSRNGTWVGGVRLWGGEGELAAGMRIVVGQTSLRVLPPSSERSEEMIGQSAAIRSLLVWIERASACPWPVLLLGESGTGKELAARAVHGKSGRRGAFVPLNCGALSPELVESELFGYEKGAFTGADRRRVGVFEQADGGTLFLDEIGELPLSLQPTLLRALETGCIRAVGSTVEKQVDVRVVAATHQDLGALVRRGLFRLDLYQRLTGLDTHMPPLRERRDDIPLLARHFLDEIAAEHGRRTLTPRAVAALQARRWPGNIRELRNALRRAALQTDRTIDIEHLPPELSLDPEHPLSLAPGIHAPAPAGFVAREAAPAPWGAPIEPATRRIPEMEREAIEQALRTHGTSRKAAQALGIPKSTLYDKARRYGIRISG